MKRLLRAVPCLLLCLILLAGTASADTGPKPAVTITVVNAPEGVYYLDLLQQDADGSPNIDREDYDPALLEGLERWEEEGWYPALLHGTSLSLGCRRTFASRCPLQMGPWFFFMICRAPCSTPT